MLGPERDGGRRSHRLDWNALMLEEQKLDPTSLVARIIAELQANPDAQRLLFRALMTNEFLGMPVRLARIEEDIVQIKTDVAQIPLK